MLVALIFVTFPFEVDLTGYEVNEYIECNQTLNCIAGHSSLSYDLNKGVCAKQDINSNTLACKIL